MRPRLALISISTLLLLSASSIGASGPVKTGLDVLVENDFAPLAGKRVGLLTAETAITSDRRRAIDVIAPAPNVQLVAIFAPEHGLSATQSGEVQDGVDEATGVRIDSLYQRERRRPTPEMLQDVDVLVHDIPQFGARFLKHNTSLGYCLEAAAEMGIPFLVLDRPNVINGGKMLGADLRVVQMEAWRRAMW